MENDQPFHPPHFHQWNLYTRRGLKIYLGDGFNKVHLKYFRDRTILVDDMMGE